MIKTRSKIKNLLKFISIVVAYAVPFTSGVLLTSSDGVSVVANVIGAATMVVTAITFVVTLPKYY